MPEWDQTHDWVLKRCWNDQTQVRIQFRNVPPSVSELAAVRRCLPQFRDTAPAAVRSAMGASGELSLGVMPSCDARELIAAAQAQGLRVVAKDASFVSYLPFDRTSGCVWLVEDDKEAAEIAQSMIAAGVPVEDIEA